MLVPIAIRSLGRASLLTAPFLVLVVGVACGSGANDEAISSPDPTKDDGGRADLDAAPDGGSHEAGGPSHEAGGPDATPDAGPPQATRITMFGGFNGAIQGGTWEFDGTAWSQRALSGLSPAPRYNFGMAALNKRVLLFGGYSDAPVPRLGDTWEWDGATWVEKVVSGPSPREAPAMGTLNGKIILFGGYELTPDGTTQALGDTWEWDGATWTQHFGAAPPARAQAAMSPLNGKLVLFGGSAHHGPMADTWLWDGSTWTQDPQPPKVGLYAASMAPLNGKLIMVGGIDGNQSGSGDFWQWDMTTWSAAPMPAPANLINGAVVAALGGKVIWFGGGGYLDGFSSGFKYSSATWQWGGSAWTELAVIGPSGRQSHGMVAW